MEKEAKIVDTCKLDKQMSTDAVALTEQLGFSVTVTSAVSMTRCRGCVWVCVYVAIFVLYCVTLATTHQHTAPPCKYDAGNRQHGKQWQVAPCYHPIWSPSGSTPLIMPRMCRNMAHLSSEAYSVYILLGIIYSKSELFLYLNIIYIYAIAILSSQPHLT